MADKTECEYQGAIFSGASVKIEVNGVFYSFISHYKSIRQDAVVIKLGDTVNIFVVFIRGPDNLFLSASRHFKFIHSPAGVSLEALSWNATTWSTRYEQKS